MMSDSPSKRSPRKKKELPEFDTLDDLYSQQDGKRIYYEDLGFW